MRMIQPSKTQIDRAGRALALDKIEKVEDLIFEDIFDAYRAAHLGPLSNTTLELQRWLDEYGRSYYIAQRLKRKPQILRKLRRLSVRLTQLQDIGGCRIIVENNKDVDDLIRFIERQALKLGSFRILRKTDYRDKGRDDTGYRSVHLIIFRENFTLELQVRSKIQHYWSESIERTSVIYGHHLKEKEGDELVILYFKKLSDIFYEIESGRQPSSQEKIIIDRLRVDSQSIILKSDKHNVFNSYVNEDIIRTLTAVQKNIETLNNWIIVFDWTGGIFRTWEEIGRDADTAIAAYVRYENQFKVEDNYEVVMIGASDISTVRQTHSHYFGIEKFDNILENLEQSLLGFNSRMDIDIGARQILGVLVRKKYWGKKTILKETLKNHFLKNLITFNSSLNTLYSKKLIIDSPLSSSSISLDVKKKIEIESYL